MARDSSCIFHFIISKRLLAMGTWMHFNFVRIKQKAQDLILCRLSKSECGSYLIHNMSPGLLYKGKRRHAPRVEQEQLIPFGITWFHTWYLWRSFCSVFNLRVVFGRSLFVLLCFIFWPLLCLFFINLRLLVTHFQALLWHNPKIEVIKKQNHENGE